MKQELQIPNMAAIYADCFQRLVFISWLLITIIVVVVVVVVVITIWL